MEYISNSLNNDLLNSAVHYFNHALILKDNGGADSEIFNSLAKSLDFLNTVHNIDISGNKGIASTNVISMLNEIFTYVSNEEDVISELSDNEIKYNPDYSLTANRLMTAYKKNDIHNFYKTLISLIRIIKENTAQLRSNHIVSSPESLNEYSEIITIINKVQINILHILLENPSKKLIAYGTLAPGKTNHHVLSDIRGRWHKCEIRGSVEIKYGYPVFNWIPSGEKIRADLFISEELNINWQHIDEFEGENYRRLLIPTVADSKIIIANCYVEKT